MKKSPQTRGKMAITKPIGVSQSQGANSRSPSRNTLRS